MRKVTMTRWALVLLTLNIFAASCEDKTVTNKELGFEITLPATWLLSSDAQTEFAVLAKTPPAYGAKYSAGVRVAVLDASEIVDLKTFVDSDLDRKTKNDNNFKIVEKLDMRMSNTACYKITAHCDLQNGLTFVDCTYNVVANKRLYVVHFGAIKDDYERYAKDIATIVKSFKLIEAK